ncbi:methionine/alanine import family NSS transporter small subunit [Isoptericola sp. 4D.3]|uniref:Methionine/alanine import family NSS transporter small subunit n=1 Tax=Isoptericola peretonis TaxID=2918523 RepID=A0ABT0J4G3_9MICO|nr:methionine/alanine import family NSS transporter small subunit [Isoptericola sp. 4D.3]
MTGPAILLMLCSLVVVWGGLLVSILALRARPERADFPEGGLDDRREDDAITERDT